MRPVASRLLRRAVLTATLVLAITVLPEPTAAQDHEGLLSMSTDVPVLTGVASALAVSPAEAEALVRTASGLIDARRRGEISFQEYRTGVLHFKKNRPSFYIGFFGDPMFYNLNKQVLVRQRQISSQEVEPFLGAGGVERAFLCEGASWDPLFQQCRGFQFARSDFLTYPTFLNPFSPQRVRTLPPVRLAVFDPSVPSSSGSGNDSTTEIDRPDDRFSPSDPLPAPARGADGNRSLKARASDNREAPSRGSADRRRTTTSIEAMASEIRPAPRRARTDRDEWERVTDGLSPDDARFVRRALKPHVRSADRSVRSERERARFRTRTDRERARPNDRVVRDRARTHDRSERATRTRRSSQPDARSPERDRQRAHAPTGRSPRTERGSRAPSERRERPSSQTDSGS